MAPLLVLGLFAFWLLVVGANSFARANPATLARLVRRAGALIAFAGAALLVARGQVELAVGVGALGVYLMGWRAGAPRFASPFRRAGAGGRASRARSAMIEMELDHESGGMRGRVLSGVFAGASLDTLARPQCDALFADCRRDDPDGARLLEAYLDRRFPGWRPAAERDRDAGSGARGGSGPMSEDEAYEVLGLVKGAGREEVTRAHRTLMKKLHPDSGGSTSLAARVNQARDVLLRRHL